MASRTPFTDNEDTLLVKYIAKYNPSAKGRSGNDLYRTLCKDIDNKWKWSRTHTWQSWRDRYYKNKEEFDMKIKKYQITHDLLPTNENMDGKSLEEKLISRYKREREDEREEKRARVKHDSKGSQVPASATQDAVINQGKGKAVKSYTEVDPTLEDQNTQGKLSAPSIDVVTQEMAVSTTPTSPPPMYPDIKKPLSPNILPNPHNVNQETSMTERQRKSPITYQTSHRVILADSQPVASTSKAHTMSNHRRRKPVRKDDVFFEPSPPAPSPLSPGNITHSKHRKPKLVEGPFGTRFASRRKSDGSADNSSEDEKDATAWPPSRKRSNFQGKGKVVEATNTLAGTLSLDEGDEPDVFPASGPRTVNEHHPREVSPSSMNVPDKGQEEVDDVSTSVQRHCGRLKHPSHREDFQEVNETPDQRCLQVSSGPFYDTLNPDLALKAEGGVTVYEPRKLLPPRRSWTPNNPFQPTDETVIRRHSMGNLREVQRSTVRRLDLRAEMVKRRFAASSPFAHSRGHSIASTMSYQPSPVSSHGRGKPATSFDNLRRRRSSIPVADEDREHIEFLGLNVAIEGIARESGFLSEQVWRIYDHYRSIRRTKEWIRLYRKNSARLQELTHEQMMKNGLGALASADEQRTSWPSFLDHSQKYESTEHTLSTPETQENLLKIKRLPTDFQRFPSEYSPPHETRAGEYNRLVGQGRVEEAMLRERRRASGSGGVFPRLRWGTPHQSSPSNGTTETIERDEEEIEDEDIVPLLDRSRSQAVLQEEEEKLFLTASVGMTDRLRAIEQNMDPDYMLRWVAARLGGMTDEFRSSSAMM